MQLIKHYLVILDSPDQQFFDRLPSTNMLRSTRYVEIRDFYPKRNSVLKAQPIEQSRRIKTKQSIEMQSLFSSDRTLRFP